MEYTVGLLIAGSFILLVTMYRLRKIRQYRGLEQRLLEAYDVSGLDRSGNTRYVSCYSHKWVLDNITKKSHSRIGLILQDHLADSTLIAGMWIGFIAAISSMILALLFVQSLRAIGAVIIIFLVGLLIALGPGGPRYAENLLDAVIKKEINELNAQDYVYVNLANDTIKQSVVMNVIIASIFILVAPWGDLLPNLFAQGIALFTVNLIWEPAILLLNYNIAISIMYIASIIGITSFVCFRIARKLASHENEAPVIHY
ncbi:MAG: hypothetical protein ACFFDQ_10845 [Candidatus Thorarchaeota archaeon]